MDPAMGFQTEDAGEAGLMQGLGEGGGMYAQGAPGRVTRVEASLDLGMQVLAGVGLPYKGPKLVVCCPGFGGRVMFGLCVTAIEFLGRIVL